MTKPLAAVSRDLKGSLADTVGAAHVRDDAAARALFSQDIYSRAPHEAALVVAPANAAELQRVVAIAGAAGAVVIARGAGMSYTGAYLPAAPGAIMIDMTRMNRVLAINAEDMTVVVEAGATWALLFAALKAKGLRTPFYGPLSGLTSTIGGGLSQGNALLGAAKYGPSSDSVVALKVVAAGGRLVDTGAIGAAPAFFRHYGPDLAGLFLGDAGALGIKAEATLRLIAAPAAEAYASFSFRTRDETIAAASALARTGAFAEIFGFDPALQRVRMKRASIGSDVKALAKVVRGQKSLFSGVREAAKIAVAGRDFVDADGYSLHLVAEGRSEAAVAADLAAARDIARRHGGREIENTIPKVVRADPFTPLNNMIGPEGERWAPVHGVLAHSAAPRAWAAIDAYFAEVAPRFAQHGVTTGCLVTTLSTNAVLIEPVFYWRTALDLIHRATVEKWLLDKIVEFPAFPAANAVVDEARKRVARIFLDHGAAHFQIGKTYLYREGRDAAAYALLRSIKAALDPEGRINPGALGLA
jgi:FAD/FMN-containing dehydrogenase